MDGHEEIAVVKKLCFTLPILAAFLFIRLFTVSVSSLHAQSLGMIVPLENQVTKNGLEGAKARVFVFTNGPQYRTNLEIDAKKLHCRSGGTLPNCPDGDRLGAAFYSLYLTTVNEPPTRLHIFNTNCSTDILMLEHYRTGFSVHHSTTNSNIEAPLKRRRLKCAAQARIHFVC